MAGLAVTSLTLLHFRSHVATRMAFDGRVVAISGPNGAGKTNILEAVSLLSPGRGLRRAGGSELARRPENVGWKIRAEAAGLAGSMHEIETWAEGDGSRALRIDDKTAPQSALGRILRVVWLVPAMDRLWTEGAEGRRRFLDRLTLSFAPEHADISLAYEKAMRERNRLLREGVADAHWYTALEGRMAEAAVQITANRLAALARLGAAQEGVETAFPQADLALVGPEGAPAPENLAAALAEGRRRDMAAGRTLLGPHRADLAALYAARDMPADQCSTGEQKALLISLVLASARALAEDLGQAPVLLFDEVSAHLDPDRRAALYDELCALDAQALLTGTEPALFESLGARAQSFQVIETGGRSRVAPATPGHAPS